MSLERVLILRAQREGDAESKDNCAHRGLKAIILHPVPAAEAACTLEVKADMRTVFFLVLAATAAHAQIVLHATRLLDVETGRMLSPGEVLVRANASSKSAPRSPIRQRAQIIDLGDSHSAARPDRRARPPLPPSRRGRSADRQESVPQRTIVATLAARDDLMAGFTAERDMGTEGAGSADTAVRNAIDGGLIPGPRLRISGNAVDILGGHEDAIGYNPAQHVLPNATWANNAAELVAVIRAAV